MSEEEGMQGHCCCCVSGVLLTFLGISLLSTGISMVLDYGAFDMATLPSGWQSSDGQRNLGIILICAALLSLTVSVVVSVLFFTSCHKGRTGPQDSESHVKGDNSAEVAPRNQNVVQTLTKASDHSTSTRSSHRRSKGKHGRKKSRKQTRVQLETHHESVEEHSDYTHARDTRSTKRRSANSAHLRERQKRECSSGVIQDHVGGELDAAKPVTSLPPVIAPAPEGLSICDPDNSNITKFNEPVVFRVSPGSMSSDESLSIIGSSGTGDTFRPWPSPRDAVQQETFDRELSDILK